MVSLVKISLNTVAGNDSCRTMVLVGTWKTVEVWALDYLSKRFPNQISLPIPSLHMYLSTDSMLDRICSPFGVCSIFLQSIYLLGNWWVNFTDLELGTPPQIKVSSFYQESAYFFVFVVT
jgi:hypothetical protein